MTLTNKINPAIFGILLLLLFSNPGICGEEHEDHHEDENITLDRASMASLNLKPVTIEKGSLSNLINMPASVMFDPKRVAHLTPRVAGAAREIFFQLGDVVKEGDCLAVLDSRELGAAKSAWLAARARENLRGKTYDREQDLWKKRITSEQDYLEAQNALEESRIETRIARQTLLALGVTDEILETLAQNRDQPLTRYQLTAPFGGEVTEQHISLGEVMKEEDTAFVLVDKSQVWIMARVYERDIRKLEMDSQVTVSLEAFPGEVFRGNLDYIGSRLDEETRTVEARVVLKNPGGKLIAGMFGRVTAQEKSKTSMDHWLIPSSGVQRTEHGDTVYQFVKEGVYKPIPVTVVNRSSDFCEVRGALQPGIRVVVGDTFILKSEAGKAAMGEGHSH